MTTRDRVRGAIYGHLVGDALGVPYEFTHDIETVEWRGNGTHNQPAGTWSDDGALMLALLDSLLDAGFDTADQARRFLDWRDHRKYTPDRDGRFDIGGATSQALARVADGVPAEEAGDDPDALGNGSLMRILPIALVDPSASTAELVDRAHRSSRITHGAPACLVACALYVLITRELLAGGQDRSSALARSSELLRAEYQGQSELVTALDNLLAWPTREGRGHVSDSFWSAWDAFEASDGYRSAVVRAVQYGNDTDTTAAIAGGLAGTYWGLDSIPGPWLNGLRGKEVVDRLLDRLVRRLDPNREPRLPAMDPDFTFSMSDLDAMEDHAEWHRIRRPRRSG
ncbi:MAG: ADP-ribosylglycohydrolase family protein [Chloroflexi bacterium]|nr:ADP-ribosylglycohydrolase family protein [Chloroflexota bacterium]